MNSKLIRPLYALAVLVVLAVAGMAGTAQAYDHGRGDRGHDHDWRGHRHYYTGGYYAAPPPVVYGYPGYAAPPPVVYDEEPAVGINLHIR